MAVFEIPRTEVRQFLRVIRDTSKIIAKQLKDELQRIQDHPSEFKELIQVPDFIAQRPDICIRKVKIQHAKHNFRLLFIHQT